MKRKLSVVLIMFSAIILAGCSGNNKLEGSFNLVISEEKTVEVFIEDLAEMDRVDTSVVEKTQIGESTVNVTGAYLNDLLEENGISQKDIETITLKALDGYEKQIPKEVIQANEILLVYFVEGEKLTEEASPLWVVIPNEKAQFWVKNIDSITLF